MKFEPVEPRWNVQPRADPAVQARRVFEPSVLAAMRGWRFERAQPVKNREFTFTFSTAPYDTVYGKGIPFP